jgi:polysaccharide export outer membrane protein
MRKSYIRKFFLTTQILFLSIVVISCSSTKDTKYFQDIPDSGRMKVIAKTEYIEPVIQVDDILTILIQTIDPLTTEMINNGNGGSMVGAGGANPVSGAGQTQGGVGGLIAQSNISGYLVDKDGNLDLPVLGKVQAAGHTVPELKAIILDVASRFYKNPTVIVRFANFKISVAGEVARPGTYIMPNEKVTILDAISVAGDLTIFGKRDNILLIRENSDGTKTPYRINLKKSDFMTSSYYYLRQNDYIYIEPGKGKAAATDASQTKYIAIVASALSVLIVLLSRR